MVRYHLFVAVFFFCCTNMLYSQLTYNTLYVDYDSAITYKNLKVVPIRQKKGTGGVLPDILTLNQAIKQGAVSISERGTASTENVHWLRLNNSSDKAVFIGSGEVVMGGRQDRMVTRDTLLLPGSGDQYFQTMCVEEGRWSDKEKKFMYGNYANPRLRKVLDRQRNQLLIWKEIYSQLDSNKIVSPTLSYAARKIDKRFVQKDDEYLRYFKEHLLDKDTSITGIVCISGNRIMAADIFSKSALFADQAVSLLSGFIEEAVTSGSTPGVSDADLKVFMDKILEDETKQEEYCKKNGKLYRYMGRVIHLTAYVQ